MTANRHERCDIQIESGRTIKLVPEPNEEQLNDKQLVDYREHRAKFIQWLLEEGKNPEKREGYSPYSVYGTGYRTARFDRWVWAHEDRYTIPPSPEHGDEYMDEHVAYRDVSTSTKGKTEEALMRYYRWIEATSHAPAWDREQRFRSGGSDRPRDFLTRRERRLVRETALEHGDGWRVASLVLTSLDAGLRPIEVSRAKPSWVDVDNMLLRIPREDSSKNKDNWRVSLTSRTATALEHWLDERAELEKYDGRDELWLTRESTPYGSRSLSRLLKRLCENSVSTSIRSVQNSSLLTNWIRLLQQRVM